jgi:HD-GYP domain-containing protein (c-di-GMP phosphodiesterase class II)
MTTTRSYRAALPLETALAELQANSGTQFDPTVVEALIRLLPADTSNALHRSGSPASSALH